MEPKRSDPPRKPFDSVVDINALVSTTADRLRPRRSLILEIKHLRRQIDELNRDIQQSSDVLAREFKDLTDKVQMFPNRVSPSLFDEVETPDLSDKVKQLYRAAARKLHPDVSDDPDAEAKFKDLSAAAEEGRVEDILTLLGEEDIDAVGVRAELEDTYLKLNVRLSEIYQTRGYRIHYLCGQDSLESWTEARSLFITHICEVIQHLINEHGAPYAS